MRSVIVGLAIFILGFIMGDYIAVQKFNIAMGTFKQIVSNIESEKNDED